jgi:hypothetical protein
VCASHRQILVCIVADSSRSLCVVRASWQKFSTPDLVTEIWVLEILFLFLPFILAKTFGFEEFWVRGLVQNFAEQELVRNSHLLLQ